MRATYPKLLILFSFPVALQAQDLVPSWGGALGSTGSDSGTGIALDNTGHVYTTGSFTGTTDFDPGPGVYNLTSAGTNDIYVTKFDTSGTLIWARTMGGAFSDGATSIVVDDAGNVYTTGGFCGTADFDPGMGTFTLTAATTGQNDIFVSKLDADGNFVWAKGVVGGTWWDAGFGIALDPVGNVVVTGRFYYQGGPRDFDPGPGTFYLTAGHEDIFVLKLDGDGNFIWAVDFGTAPDESRGYSIAVDDAGNILTTGYFRGTVDFDPGPGTFDLTSPGTWSIFYLKLDPDGMLVWAKSLPISTSTYHNEGGYGGKIAIDADGNLLTTGRYSGTIDLDPGVATVEVTAVGLYDIYVCKYTAAGELVWARSIGGAAHDEGYGITARADGSVMVVGTFRATADLDPGPSALELTSTGGDDAFILNMDGNGDLIRATSFGGTGDDRGYGVVSSANGAIYLTGWFMGTTDLDPGGGTVTAASAGSNDAYVVKLVENNEVGISERSSFDGSAISVFPNPTQGPLSIVADAALFGQRAVVEVFDATGSRVHAEQVNYFAALQPLDLSQDWKEGLFLVLVRVEGQAPRSARLIVARR